MRGAAALALALLSLGAPLGAEAPAVSPSPEARPAEAAKAARESTSSGELETDSGTAAETAAESEPVAEESPDTGSDGEETGAETPASEEASTEEASEAAGPPDPMETPAWEALEADEAAHQACLSELRDLGADFTPAEPVSDAENRDCGIARPINLSRVLPGVALRPAAEMRCPTALALARWTRDFVQPAAQRLEGREGLAAIAHGSAYVCRSRSSGARLSEHALGNALDIMGFVFGDGSTIPVEPRERTGTMEESFQRAVRHAACMEFTTVLGPGTDAAHADHLHLDIKARRGGFRLCQ